MLLSVVPHVAKFYEIILKTLITTYLDSTINSATYEFRKNLSTKLATVCLISFIKYVIFQFLDLSKLLSPY